MPFHVFHLQLTNSSLNRKRSSAYNCIIFLLESKLFSPQFSGIKLELPPQFVLSYVLVRQLISSCILVGMDIKQPRQSIYLVLNLRLQLNLSHVARRHDWIYLALPSGNLFDLALTIPQQLNLSHVTFPRVIWTRTDPFAAIESILRWPSRCNWIYLALRFFGCFYLAFTLPLQLNLPRGASPRLVWYHFDSPVTIESITRCLPLRLNLSRLASR